MQGFPFIDADSKLMYNGAPMMIIEVVLNDDDDDNC